MDEPLVAGAAAVGRRCSTEGTAQGGGHCYADPTTGGIYTPPLAGQLAMPAASKLSFSNGGLAPDFDQPVTIAKPSATSLINTAVPASPVTNTTKITKFDVKTGALAGSFLIGTRSAPFTGQIVKIGSTTEAYGFFLLPTGVPDNATSPKLSGKVVLGAPQVRLPKSPPSQAPSHFGKCAPMSRA